MHGITRDDDINTKLIWTNINSLQLGDAYMRASCFVISSGDDLSPVRYQHCLVVKYNLWSNLGGNI